MFEKKKRVPDLGPIDWRQDATVVRLTAQVDELATRERSLRELAENLEIVSMTAAQFEELSVLADDGREDGAGLEQERERRRRLVLARVDARQAGEALDAARVALVGATMNAQEISRATIRQSIASTLADLARALSDAGAINDFLRQIADAATDAFNPSEMGDLAAFTGAAWNPWPAIHLTAGRVDPNPTELVRWIAEVRRECGVEVAR